MENQTNVDSLKCVRIFWLNTLMLKMSKWGTLVLRCLSVFRPTYRSHQRATTLKSIRDEFEEIN